MTGMDSKSQMRRINKTAEFDPLRSTNMYLEHSEYWIYCHEERQCKMDFCTLHNRSNHHMRDLPQSFRFDRMIMERICEHGIGHPDPDEFRIRNGEDDGVHGCDGCCRSNSSENT